MVNGINPSGPPPVPQAFDNHYVLQTSEADYRQSMLWMSGGAGETRYLNLLATPTAPYCNARERVLTPNISYIEAAIRYMDAQPQPNGNARYWPADGSTFCNIYVNDATRILYCEIPNDPAYTSVAQMMNWLQVHGAANGWRLGSGQEAQDAVNAGNVAVMIRHDHVALVRPGISRVEQGVAWPRVAQAGVTVSGDADSYVTFPPYGVVSDICPGIASRFAVGISGVAVRLPTTHLRYGPDQQQTIIREMAPNTPFQVIGGPQCGTQAPWWQIQLGDGTIGWVEEGWPGAGQPDYYINPTSRGILPVFYIHDGVVSNICPGIPSRFAVGFRGITVRQPVTHLRSAPDQSKPIIRDLAPNTHFQVIDGPQCGTESPWWQIQLDDGTIGWAEEGWPEIGYTDYYIQPTSN